MSVFAGIHRGGFAAALTVLALWYAAPLIGGATGSPAARARNALILGIAIPFVLGLFAVFNAFTYAGAVSFLCVLRFLYRSNNRKPAKTHPPELYWLPALVVTSVAWPQMVRPMLDGDSMAYHLPNAAAWVHAHSLWTTTTYYWWYPPASELFAAGLLAVSGPFSLGIAGIAASLLIGFRLAEWGATFCNSWLAAALSAATISVPSFAFQTGNLQNDVWLGAFFIEALWAYAGDRNAACRSVAALSIIKPIGFIFSALAQIANVSKVRLPALLCYAPIAIWAVHNLILAPRAMVHTPQSSYGWVWSTTIAAQGIAGLSQVAAAVYGDGYWTVLLALSALILLPFRRQRALTIAAFVTLALYLVLPFAYQTAVPQLAGGHSLRFLVPLFALGTLGLAAAVRRAPAAVCAIPLAVATFNVKGVLDVFWNDATVHNFGLACGVAAAVSIAAVLLPPRVMRVPAMLFLISFVMWSHELAIANPAPYYDDAERDDGKHTAFFRWLQHARLQRVVVQDLRSGIVDVLSPATVVYDADKPHACEQARALHAVFIIGPDAGPYDGAPCGRVLYADALMHAYDP